jgi:hypothetical protein
MPDWPKYTNPVDNKAEINKELINVKAQAE